MYYQNKYKLNQTRKHTGITYNIRTLQHYNKQIDNIIKGKNELNKLQKRLIINACKSIVYCANHSGFNPGRKGYKYNQTINKTIKTVRYIVPNEIIDRLVSIKTI